MTFSRELDSHTNGSPMAPLVKKSISVSTCINVLQICSRWWNFKQQTFQSIIRRQQQTTAVRWIKTQNKTFQMSVKWCLPTKTTNFKAICQKELSNFLKRNNVLNRTTARRSRVCSLITPGSTVDRTVALPIAVTVCSASRRRGWMLESVQSKPPGQPSYLFHSSVQLFVNRTVDWKRNYPIVERYQILRTAFDEFCFSLWTNEYRCVGQSLRWCPTCAPRWYRMV